MYIYTYSRMYVNTYSRIPITYLYYICIVVEVSFSLSLSLPPSFSLMMMIAFITINSGLVLLIDGLCAQILYFRFEILSFRIYSFVIHALQINIYTYIYTYIYIISGI